MKFLDKSLTGLICKGSEKKRSRVKFQVQVDAGFKSEMDKMNGWAKQCSVTIQITHAFRKEGQSIGGTVVPPGKRF